MQFNIDNTLTRGVFNILPSKEGLAKLMKSKKITLYQGFDPSMPSLHLGNLVGLMKLRQFQKLGHKVIFLIGDFTGMIGDPTDKKGVRKKLTREQIIKNSHSWKEQASRVLDFDGENAAQMLFNSSWSDKLTFKDLIEITSNFTVGQMIERDMFQERIAEGKPVFLHEFLYPVAQAYDSVAMDVDLEIGGSDQIFNMLAGRSLMKAVKDKEKYVLSTKLLVDKQGNKVGKTTGNALFLDSKPEDFYAGVMSFPDETIYDSYELLTEVDLTGLKEDIKNDPMQKKKDLALEIVKLLWSQNDAQKAQKTFEKNYQEKEPVFGNSFKLDEGTTLVDAVAQITDASTTSAKRLVNSGAVDVDGKTISDTKMLLKKGSKVKIGKKIFVKIS